MSFSEAFSMAADRAVTRSGRPSIVYTIAGEMVLTYVYISRQLIDSGDIGSRPEYEDMAYVDVSVYRPVRGDYIVQDGIRWDVVGTLDGDSQHLASIRIQRRGPAP